MGSLNERIKTMRKYLRLSQTEFAQTGNISQSTQNRYEQPGTDIPLSYIQNIYDKYGTSFNQKWLYHGKGEMLKTTETASMLAELSSGKIIPDLTAEESRIVLEVQQFSDFLKNRPLQPSVKRRLLELLIESIDQALNERLDREQ